MAQEEAMKRRGKGNLITLTGCKDLSGKHPVSALLELCTRRRWGPPSFSQVIFIWTQGFFRQLKSIYAKQNSKHIDIACVKTFF